MKKTIMLAGLVLLLNNAAYADGSAFTPLNFNDTSYGSSSMTMPMTSSSAMSDEAIGNGNIQNAISQLEDAQVDIRNDLMNLKTKFADVDAQYKLIKSERATLKSQMRSVERRIKDIERAKTRIRKNML